MLSPSRCRHKNRWQIIRASYSVVKLSEEERASCPRAEIKFVCHCSYNGWKCLWRVEIDVPSLQKRCSEAGRLSTVRYFCAQEIVFPAVEISAPLNIWISRLRWQQTIYFCLLHWRLSVCLHRLPPLQYLCSRCCGLLTQFTEGCGLHKEIREWDGLEMEWVWSGLWREWWPYSFLFKVLIQGAAESFLIPIFDRLYALYISWVRSFPFLICTTWVCGAKVNT